MTAQWRKSVSINLIYFNYLLVSCFIPNITEFNNYEENEIRENSKDWTFDTSKFAIKEPREPEIPKQNSKQKIEQTDRKLKLSISKDDYVNNLNQGSDKRNGKSIYSKPSRTDNFSTKLKNLNFDMETKKETNLSKKRHLELDRKSSSESNTRTSISLFLECIDNHKPQKFDARLVSVINLYLFLKMTFEVNSCLSVIATFVKFKTNSKNSSIVKFYLDGLDEELNLSLPLVEVMRRWKELKGLELNENEMRLKFSLQSS